MKNQDLFPTISVLIILLTEILIALVKGTLWADSNKTQVRKSSLLSMLVSDYMIIQDGAYVKELKTETSWV